MSFSSTSECLLSWKYSIILLLILSMAVGEILVCTIVVHSEWKVKFENKILVFLIEVKSNISSKKMLL